MAEDVATHGVPAIPHVSSDGRTEDLCVFNNPKWEGSRCDEFANKCTLPLRERKLKTIPWYYGPEAPADLFPSTAFALNSWNIAMKRAAILGMRADALRLGDTDTASMAVALEVRVPLPAQKPAEARRIEVKRR